MFNTIKAFFENLNWISILSSLVVNLFAIYAAYRSIKSYIKRKRLFRVKRNKDGLLAFSIGLGKNDPYQAVAQYMKEENKDKILKYYKSHKSDINAFLTDEEVQSAIKDIDAMIGKLRRENFKEVLVFYAGPVSAALQIGYRFKNFYGTVKFMQPDPTTKEYKVMLMPIN